MDKPVEPQAAARPVIVVVVWECEEAHLPRVLAAVAEMREHTLAEPGCLEYSVYRSQTSPTTFVLHERYRDQAALDAHMASSHFQTLVLGTVVPLLRSRVVHILAPL